MSISRIFDVLDQYQEKYPNKADAFVSKEKGEWVRYSSKEYIELSNAVSYGLMKLGCKKGDKIATISNNRPEWNFVDMGMAQLGIIHVPIFSTLDANGYKQIFNHAEIKLLFVFVKLRLNFLLYNLIQ